jgi:uncharacterized membrane protein YeaQ/YmgE (transglycosylase-associated protein family)
MPVLLLVLLAIVLLVVLGWAIVGLTLYLLWWALIGLILGGLGRLAVPGRQSIGLLATAASGVAGSLLGGVVAHVAHLGGVLQFVIAVVLAAALVMVFAATQRKRAQ